MQKHKAPAILCRALWRSCHGTLGGALLFRKELGSWKEWHVRRGLERQPARSWEPGGPGSAQDPRCGHRLPVAIGKPSFPFSPFCSSHCSFESGFSCDSKKENVRCPIEALNPWTPALLPMHCPVSQKPFCFSPKFPTLPRPIPLQILLPKQQANKSTAFKG